MAQTKMFSETMAQEPASVNIPDSPSENSATGDDDDNSPSRVKSKVQRLLVSFKELFTLSRPFIASITCVG